MGDKHRSLWGSKTGTSVAVDRVDGRHAWWGMTRQTSRSIAIYSASVLIIILGYFWVALHFPNWLYLGRDADNNLWLKMAYEQWAKPLDITGYNPLEGMTSWLMPINPYFDAGSVGLWLGGYGGLGQVLSFTIYFAEVFLSTFLLTWSLGFLGIMSLISSLWLTILLFPPFNFAFGMMGWLATAGFYAHELALGNLFLCAFIFLGSNKITKGLRSVGINVGLWTAINIIILEIFVVSPFYGAALLEGSGVAAAAIFAASNDIRQYMWRLGAGISVILFWAMSGAANFYIGSAEYIIRPVRQVGFLQWIHAFHWGINTSTASAKSLLCTWGIVCYPLYWLGAAGLPIPIISGSYWIPVMVVLGGVLCALSQPRALVRVAATFTSIWVLFLLYAAARSVSIIPPTPGPFAFLHFYFMLSPFIAVFSLYPAAYAISKLFPRMFEGGHRRRGEHFAAVGVAAAWLTVGALIAAHGPPMRTALTLVTRHGSPPFVKQLETVISLHPGSPFRGYVATILGSPGGSIRPVVGLTANEPLPFMKFLEFPAAIGEAGSSLDFHDLWWHGIPTLSEYGQGVSKPLMVYIHDLLSSPGDVSEINYAVPKAIDVDVLRAMGVRFVITDREISSPLALLRDEVKLTNGTSLLLYELANPNLATFSPTVLIKGEAAPTIISRIKEDPSSLEHLAYVTSEGFGQLVPVRNSRLIFERGGFRIMAESDGRSALLLPVQFSRCYLVEGAHPGLLAIERADLLHTLIVFDRTINLMLRWRFSPWANSDCRLRDSRDLAVLNLP
jgi:hypothetical protein